MWPFGKNRQHAIRTSQPYWWIRDGAGDAGTTLRTSAACDVAVIGAGITAAFVVDALVSTGRRIVVLDASEPGSGSTAASTALLQYEIDTPLVELTGRIGADRAMRAYLACAETFDILERRYPEPLRESEYERRTSLYVAHRESMLPALRAEAEARRSIGIACEWIDEDELRREFGCLRPGAILSRRAAQLDPLRLTRALLASSARHGVKVHSRSPVAAIEEAGDRFRLLVNGHVIDAGAVVVAAGYESLKFLDADVATLHHTFALVTEPLDDASRVASMPLIWETARPYLYARGTRDGRLIVGGADVPFRSTAARDALLPRQIRSIAKGHESLFGRDLPPIANAWAGSFAETKDGLPCIGALPGGNPRLLYALCYGGNGITFAVHAAALIRARLLGEPHALADVFGFERLGRDATSAAGAAGR